MSGLSSGGPGVSENSVATNGEVFGNGLASSEAPQPSAEVLGASSQPGEPRPSYVGAATQPQVLPTSGLAIAGMVLGIVALATSFIPILNFGSPLLAIVGLILSIVSLSGIKKGNKQGRGIAVAGIVLCAIVTVFALLISAACSAAMSTSNSSSSSGSSTEGLKSGESAASAAYPAFSVEGAKASFVGTWDMISFTDADHNFDESDLEAARKKGVDSYLALNEDGTGLFVMGDASNDITWELTSDTDGSFRSGSLSGTFTLDGDVLKMGHGDSGISFRKGQPRDTTSAASGDSQSEQAASGGSQSDSSAAEESKPAEDSQPSATASEAEAPEPEAAANDSDATSANLVDPALKEMLDSYEAFMDEYIEFMQNYQDSGDTMSMLQDYSDYMQRYSDFMQKVNAVDTENMSAADYAYYIEVTSRVSQKLLAVSGL